jgi:putative component of membrane protein insertase Oxa1/YidC/SpoIIIJ protein YidD
MKNCNFDPNSCSVECKKYPICSYYSIQNQFIEVKSQLNFIYDTITQILKTNETSDNKISLLEQAIREKIFCDDDSETKEKNKKESKYEKEN